MGETALAQRVDSAEMLDLFSQAELLDDGDDFLSPTKNCLTHDDVRHLRLDPKEDSRGFLAPVRVGEAKSELHLRATGKEDAWLLLSPSQRQVSVSTADSIDEYLRLKDASRPSFSKRSACGSEEGERRPKGSVKAFAKQPGGRDSLPRRRASVERKGSLERRPSLGACSDKSSSTACGRSPSAGGRRKKTPSPALTDGSSLEGRDPLQSYGSSSCATPTPAPDPPNSPCSSSRSSRIPTPKNGRSRLPSPTLSECRSNISSPALSDPHSRFSSPTPSERSLRRGGQKSWPAGPGSDCDPYFPKSGVGEYGNEDNGQKLFNGGGLTKLQKQMKAAQEAVKKGTRLKAKEMGSSRWKGA